MSKGNLIIITAPSGTGKTSLVRELVASVTNLKVSVSYTTRPPRPKDKPDIDYHFVSESTFQAMIDHQDLLEHAVIYNHYYGTSRRWVEEQLEQGIDVLLEIDWQGARQIMQQFHRVVSIFILPPSMQALERRITKRAQDSSDVIKMRLQAAHEEVKHYHEFSYLVVNDVFETALADITHIILAQRLQCTIQQEILTGLLSGLIHNT